jgi:hypothetical protein
LCSRAKRTPELQRNWQKKSKKEKNKKEAGRAGASRWLQLTWLGLTTPHGKGGGGL